MTPVPNVGYQDIEIGFLLPSPTNPRKTFRDIDELAASIETIGLIHALTIRPILPENYKDFPELKKAKIKDGVTYYEVVSGERRLRALRQLAQKSKGEYLVTCSLRYLKQDEVIDIQITENLQRDDLPPMDEAEALNSLHVVQRMSVKELALRLGKSETYILTRLQLMKLVPKIRKSLADDEISLTLAIELARLNEASQRQAFKWAKETTLDGDNTVTHFKAVKEVKAYIKNHMFLELSEAAFNLKDAKLVPKAGACTTCPKNTSCSTLLFADITGARCTDKVCFSEKIDAHRLQEFKKYGAAASKANQPPIYLNLNYSSVSDKAKIHSFYGIDGSNDRNEYHFGSETVEKLKAKKLTPFIAFVIDAPGWGETEMIGTVIEVFPNDEHHRHVLNDTTPEDEGNEMELMAATMDAAARETYLKGCRKELERKRATNIEEHKYRLINEQLLEKADIKQDTPPLSEMQFFVYVVITAYDFFEHSQKKIVTEHLDKVKDFKPPLIVQEWTKAYDQLKDPDLVLPTYLDGKLKALYAKPDEIEDKLDWRDWEALLVHLCGKLTKFECWKILRTGMYDNAERLTSEYERPMIDGVATAAGVDVGKAATAAGRKYPKKDIEKQLAEIQGVFKRIPPPDPSPKAEDDESE